MEKIILDEEAFRVKLRDFILYKLPSKNKSSVKMQELEFSTELFETGFVSSLGIIQLISFIEAETGKKISIREVTITHFRTIDSIVTKFIKSNG